MQLDAALICETLPALQTIGHTTTCISQHVRWLAECMCVDMTGMFCPAMLICLRGATKFECPASTSDLFGSLGLSRAFCTAKSNAYVSGTNPFLASNQGVLLSHVTIATGLHGFVQLLLACGPVSSRERCLQLYLVWTWADVNVV